MNDQNGISTDSRILIGRDNWVGTEAARKTFMFGLDGMLFSTRLDYVKHSIYKTTTFRYRVNKET